MKYDFKYRKKKKRKQEKRKNAEELTSYAYMRALMGLTGRRKTSKNLIDSSKNWKLLTVSRK